jgi:solute carrier family 25 carnitine/acylcarnitine transporter 20/29|eukprot:jgi/Chrpa1/21658/Chrysochromulina_OHIO_Genome00005339-RA
MDASFVAGWVSGVVGLAVTQPIDFLLTKLQSGATAQVNKPPNGLLSMWRGSALMFATVPLNNAMLMYGYGAGKRVGDAYGGESILPVFIGGCTGGFMQSFLQSPVELLKVRLQLAMGKEVPTVSTLTRELLRPSPRGAAAVAPPLPPLLHKGLYATLLRDVVPHGVWFAAYEYSKKHFERRASEAAGLPVGATPPPLSTVAQLSSGAFAAIAAWVVGYPADVIKTRCQMEGGQASVAEAARAIHAEGGLRAFYNGLGLKLLRAVPMSAVGFFAYEYAMGVLGKLQAKQIP